MFLQFTIKLRLNSVKKLPNNFTNSFFEFNFLFNCVEKFSKTVRRPVKRLIFKHYLCIFNVYLVLGETSFGSLLLESLLSTASS